MSDTDILSALSADELFMVCSHGGRVLHVSPSLSEAIGIDLVGKNLNDVIEDRIVSRLIINVERENVYEFDCVISNRAFSCGAKLSPSDNIVIVLDPAVPEGNEGSGVELIRYMGREINANLDNINIVFGAMKRRDRQMPAEALGLMQKSILNLTRISKNAVTKVDYEEGALLIDLKKGDMPADIAEVCRQAAEFCRNYAEITIEYEGQSAECIYDPTAIKRMMLNLISYNIAKSALKYPRIAIRLSRKEDILLITVSSAGSGMAESIQDEEGMVYGRDIELDIAVVIARKHRGSIIATRRRDGGQVYRVTLPIISENPKDGLSSMMIDWYGGMNIVAVELSGVMPPQAYDRL